MCKLRYYIGIFFFSFAISLSGLSCSPILNPPSLRRCPSSPSKALPWSNDNDGRNDWTVWWSLLATHVVEYMQVFFLFLFITSLRSSLHSPSLEAQGFLPIDTRLSQLWSNHNNSSDSSDNDNHNGSDDNNHDSGDGNDSI
jgi:hypothetical protein